MSAPPIDLSDELAALELILSSWELPGHRHRRPSRGITSRPDHDGAGFVVPDILSAHARIRAIGAARRVEAIVMSLPLVDKVQDQVFWTLSIDPKPTFAIHVAGMKPLAIGSGSIAVASRNFDDLKDRLAVAEEESRSQPDDPGTWQIERRGCDTKWLHARCPREAALKYSALCVRSYHEAREWKTTPASIRKLLKVMPERLWQ